MSPCKVIQESHAACKGEFRLNSLLTGLLFFLRFAEFPENANQMRRVLLPGIMFHEVATLVHLIESSKPEARAEGIRLIVLLEVPRLLEGRPCLASVAIDNLSRDKAVHDNKTVSCLSRLCR